MPCWISQEVLDELCYCWLLGFLPLDQLVHLVAPCYEEGLPMLPGAEVALSLDVHLLLQVEREGAARLSEEWAAEGCWKVGEEVEVGGGGRLEGSSWRWVASRSPWRSPRARCRQPLPHLPQ